MDRHPHHSRPGSSPSPPASPPRCQTTPRLPSTPPKSHPRELSTLKSDSKLLSLVVDPPILNLTSKPTGCNCRKSQCLKMYCICFAQCKMCDSVSHM